MKTPHMPVGKLDSRRGDIWPVIVTQYTVLHCVISVNNGKRHHFSATKATAVLLLLLVVMLPT